MKCQRTALAAIIAGLILAPVAQAKDTWKTVTLDGNPDFTVSIPATVSDYGGSKKSDDLMIFSVTADLHGGLTCMASRVAYPEASSQKDFAAKLATDRREVFCAKNGGTVSAASFGGATSFDHNGMQAAECTVSYTDSAEELPGRVGSEMIIAAPDKVYVLACTSEDEDQETAEYEWVSIWEDVVRHIQKSFHLPK